MKSKSSVFAVLLAAVVASIAATGASGAKKADHGPRPISRAEAAAVEIVAEFLASGPEAVHERLAADSALASMPEAAALAEIEVRTGPPSGASWRLQTIVPSLAEGHAVFGVELPSGIDDVIEFALVERDGRFEVASLRSLGEPSPHAVRTPFLGAEGETEPTAVAARFAPLDYLPFFGGLLALLSIASLALIRVQPFVGKTLALVTIAATVVSFHFLIGELRTVAPRASADGDSVAMSFDRLGALLEQRRALAAGLPMKAGSDLDAHARDLMMVWKAQVELRDQKLDDATQTLEHFPLTTDRPLVALVRARLAAAVHDEISSSLAYERAMRLGPGRDDLWFETAQWLFALGFEERAIGYLERLPAMRSRNADVYYALASVSGTRARKDEASAFLQTAWRLEPVPRAKIIATPALTGVMRLEDARSLVPISSPAEPRFRTDERADLLIDLPGEASATVTGGLLLISVGDDRFLRVDGGAVLVRADAELVDALTIERRDEERSLNDLPELLASGGSSSALAHPAVRERYLRTATALAERHRWADVERLTTSLSASADHVPADLLFLRGLALSKLQRESDAKRLLAEMVTSPAMQRRSDPRTLYQLGEMLAAMELYTPAIRALERVDSMMDDISLDDRIRQLSMNQRLAERYSEIASPNFVFHYPDNLDDDAVRRLADVMEAELARLKKLIPLSEFRAVTVNILWWNEFRATYTGSDHILGFYDGKITLPLAGISSLEPPIVALVTHELAHAVIAQATDDRASAWIQEGLAQRMEMVPYHANAFNMYESERLLPISLLDPALTESVDQDLIGQAYITSQTVVRFLESRYGAKIIASLLTHLRDGHSDESALVSLTGKPLDELEVEFREWGRSDNRVFENRDIVRYDMNGSYKPMVRFTKRAPGTR